MNEIEEQLNQMCNAFEKRLEIFGIEIPAEGVLAGRENSEQKLKYEYINTYIGWDNAHFPLNYAFLMEQGIPEIIRRAEEKREGLNKEQTLRREAIAKVYRLLQEYIYKHELLARQMAAVSIVDEKRLLRIATNCNAIQFGAPKTLEQGIQLFWFLWRLRNPGFSSCIGRMDVHLRKLYERDIQSGINKDEIFEVLRQLWEKLNNVMSGDTLMNIILGGVDEENNDVSSDLSVLMMEVTMKVAKSEPHINIRIHSHTPKRFIDTAAKLIAMGQGQGVIYDDEIIIPSLICHGVPEELARCYANDGCTEITIDGKSGIQFWQMEAMKTLELFLFRGKENPCAPHTVVKKWNRNMPSSHFVSNLVFGYDSGNLCEMNTFDEVFDAFMKQFTFQVNNFLNRIEEKICCDKGSEELLSSLLVCGLIPNCLDKGIDPLRGGFEVDNYQLLSGSIPTVADSLAAIKVAVFDEKYCSMADLLEAISHNFHENEALRLKLLGAPKFGNDDDRVDIIAAKIAEGFCKQVEEYKFSYDVKVWPGIYNIDFIIFASILGATPDGRYAGDAICEHFSPTPGRAKLGPTAVLRSASKAVLGRGCAASPVYVALPAGNKTEEPEIIKALINGVHKLKLPLVSFVIYDRSVLEDAMQYPQKHEDLIVRVWGYNARFIDLDESLQRHIINRIL